MNKNTLWLFVVLLIIYLSLVYGEEEIVSQDLKDNANAVQSESTELFDEARTRRRHHLHHMWGWHALAIAYWIKVKLIIVAFFVGSAVFVGLRYLWPHKCNSDVHEGPILYENPHNYAHHDHIPYSLDHSAHSDLSGFDASSSAFEPYSGYESTYSASYSDVVPSTAPEHIGKRVGKRSVRQQDHSSTKTEEQIAEFMFSFLGLDSKACRRRFICEMEFRSQENPLTSMAFRIVGRGFFAKYTNGHNGQALAQNFADCAVVNSDCVFIEQDVQEPEQDTEIVHNSETEAAVDAAAAEDQNKIEPSSAENNDISNSSDDTSAEQQNSATLQAEKRGANVRHRGDRKLNVLAERILTQMNGN